MSQSLQCLLPEYALPQAAAQAQINHWRLDSRHVELGDGFIAVPGTVSDGRQFIEAAIANEASVVLQLGSEFASQMQGSTAVLSVPNLRAQLGQILAKHYHTATDLAVIAVTGTNGKTSVTGFVQQLTQLLQQPWGLLGTFGACFNGHCEDLGLTTADAASVHRYWAEFRAAGAQGLVLEASSHALDQDRLSGLPVTTAVWTNLGRDHLDYHGTLEAYAAAKTLLWQRQELVSSVYSLDNPALAEQLAAVAPHLNTITFGKDPANDLHYSKLQCLPTGMAFVLHYQQQEWELELPLLGAFNVENLLAALAALMTVGFSLEALLPKLKQLTPVLGRMEKIVAPQGPTVVVDFAHTADGLRAALNALSEHFHRRIHCVFGCGGDRDQGKRPLMAQAAEQGAQVIWLTSDNPRTESPETIIEQVKAGFSEQANVTVVIDREEAISRAIHAAQEHDVVLIAGKGHEREQIVGTERLPFNDVAIAEAALGVWRQAQ